MGIVVAGLLLMFLIPWARSRFAPLLQGEAQCPSMWRGGRQEVSWAAGEAAWHCAVSAQQTALGRRLVSGFQKEAWRAQPPG